MGEGQTADLRFSVQEERANEGASSQVKRGEEKLSASAPSARAEKGCMEPKCFPSLRKNLFLRYKFY